jgi:hypothetical protein
VALFLYHTEALHVRPVALADVEIAILPRYSKSDTITRRSRKCDVDFLHKIIWPEVWTAKVRKGRSTRVDRSRRENEESFGETSPDEYVTNDIFKSFPRPLSRKDT